MLSLCYRCVSGKVSNLPKLSLSVSCKAGIWTQACLVKTPPIFHTITSIVYWKACTKFISFIYWVLRNQSLGLSRWLMVLSSTRWTIDSSHARDQHGGCSHFSLSHQEWLFYWWQTCLCAVQGPGKVSALWLQLWAWIGVAARCLPSHLWQGCGWAVNHHFNTYTQIYDVRGYGSFGWSMKENRLLEWSEAL